MKTVAKLILLGTVVLFSISRSNLLTDDSEPPNETRTQMVQGIGAELTTNIEIAPIRCFLWACVISFLPLSTIALIRNLTQRESNQVNAITLATYTILASLLACFTVSVGLDGWLWFASLLAATLIALLYNVWVMTIAIRLQQ